MKSVREIAVQLENKPGTLSAVSDLLGANGINILALTVRTEGAVGTMHFVAPEPSKVATILETAGYAVSVKEIIAAEAPHHPGGLNAILKPLKRANVNVEYLYSVIGCQGDRSILLLGVTDLAAAHDALSKDWIHLYGEELYSF
jgi:hypothetical protein